MGTLIQLGFSYGQFDKMTHIMMPHHSLNHFLCSKKYVSQDQFLY